MENLSVEMLFLSKDDIDSIITYEDVVKGVEETFKADGNGELVLPSKHPLKLSEEHNNILLPMSGYLKNIDAAGMKWMRFFPEQPDGIPTLWAQMIIMNDPRTGLPTAIMDGTTITQMRTAGGHAVVAAKYLAKKNSKVLGVVGAGAQGMAGITSFDIHFDLDLIKVYEAYPEGRKRCEEMMKGKTRAELVFVDTIEEVTSNVDILLSVTGAREPLIFPNHLPKGCFHAAIACFNDTSTDISRSADKWIIGHVDGDDLQIISNPRFKDNLSKDDVYSTLGEVICNKVKGRENDEEIILYTHMGMGPLDVAIGKILVDKAKQEGVGQTLKLI